jgi:predicted MFS family arabinose efflux permease
MSVTDPGPLRLAITGIGVVGTAFGMARYGYGLLLPDMQRDYGLTGAELGAIGAGSYAAYLLAAGVSGARAHASGPRATVVAGGLLATIGMVIAGLSRSPGMLAIGVLVGGASAGAVYPPFSDAVARLAPAMRGRTLSAINCGTGYGVAFAAPISILAGGAWREAWLAFAGCALITTLWGAHVLPGRSSTLAPRRPNAPITGLRSARSLLLRRESLPLLAGGFVIGLGSAAYWTFAVDHLQHDGGLSVTASRAFLGVVGVASLLSTATGDLVRRLGGRRVFTTAVAVEAVSLALLAVAPSSLTVALTSAVLFGASYNAIVAVQALWSARLYIERPSLGLAAAMAANGIGLLCGPLASGALGDAVGLTDVLLGGGAIVAVAALLAPRQPIVTGERPSTLGAAAEHHRLPASTACTSGAAITRRTG